MGKIYTFNDLKSNDLIFCKRSWSILPIFRCIDSKATLTVPDNILSNGNIWNFRYALFVYINFKIYKYTEFYLLNWNDVFINGIKNEFIFTHNQIVFTILMFCIFLKRLIKRISFYF